MKLSQLIRFLNNYKEFFGDKTVYNLKFEVKDEKIEIYEIKIGKNNTVQMAIHERN